MHQPGDHNLGEYQHFWFNELHTCTYTMINTNCVELALHSIRPNINQERFLKRKKKTNPKPFLEEKKKYSRRQSRIPFTFHFIASPCYWYNNKFKF